MILNLATLESTSDILKIVLHLWTFQYRSMQLLHHWLLPGHFVGIFHSIFYRRSRYVDRKKNTSHTNLEVALMENSVNFCPNIKKLADSILLMKAICRSTSMKSHQKPRAQNKLCRGGMHLWHKSFNLCIFLSAHSNPKRRVKHAKIMIHIFFCILVIRIDEKEFLVPAMGVLK